MLRTLLGACLAAGLLAGCSSHPEIPVSDQQALVMESSVLAAGISASEPAVVATEIQATVNAIERAPAAGYRALSFFLV